MHILVNKKYLTYFNNKVKCAVGKRGIKIKKKEGDLITPKGTFRINDIFYRKDRIKHLPTKIPKKIIKKYNWQEFKHPLCLEMILRPIKDGVKSREIPVRWKSRSEGISKNPFFGNFKYFIVGLKIRFNLY